MPVRNGQEYIQAAFNSIISQTQLDSTVIYLVDVCSTDNTLAICKQLKQNHQHNKILTVHLISTKARHAPSVARNIALRNAINNAKFISFLDHDDCWPIDRISSDLDILNTHSIDVVIGKTKIISEQDGNRTKDYRYKVDQLHNVNLGAATFRNSVFERLGLFDERLEFSEDQDYFFRMREKKISLFYADKISLYYRLHETNMTKDKSAKDLSLLTVLRKSLKRRSGARLPVFGNSIRQDKF